MSTLSFNEFVYGLVIYQSAYWVKIRRTYAAWQDEPQVSFYCNNPSGCSSTQCMNVVYTRLLHQVCASTCHIILGHYKLHFCFWSWIFPRTMRAGATSASQPPIKVNERWSSVVKMIAHRFAHALYKLLGMLKIWKSPEACGRGTRNRSTTWSGLIDLPAARKHLFVAQTVISIPSGSSSDLDQAHNRPGFRKKLVRVS